MSNWIPKKQKQKKISLLLCLLARKPNFLIREFSYPFYHLGCFSQKMRIKLQPMSTYKYLCKETFVRSRVCVFLRGSQPWFCCVQGSEATSSGRGPKKEPWQQEIWDHPLPLSCHHVRLSSSECSTVKMLWKLGGKVQYLEIFKALFWFSSDIQIYPNEKVLKKLIKPWV